MRRWLISIITGHYSILLLFLFLLFVFRPYNYGTLYTEGWKTFLTLTLIVSIFNCNHSFKTKIAISLLAIPVLVLTWLNLAYKSTDSYVLASLLTAIFMFISAASIVKDVLMRPKVTLETLRGLICAYFIVAFLFGYVYFFLEYVSPNTMQINSHFVSINEHPHFFSDMLYFSFVTLLTIGYGDVVPVHEWGETTAVVEGIIGQFYIAILVARIVTVYSRMSAKELMKTSGEKKS